MLRAEQSCLTRFRLRWLVSLALLGASSAASAAVEISFRSHALGMNFPHAYVVLSGTLDGTGERVDENYGFTVRNQIGPSILFGPVQGTIASEGREIAAGGRRHFSMVLSDAEYHRVTRLVARWRALPQPSYYLDRRTCVTFVAEVATTLGLRAEVDGTTRRRPQAFLERVLQTNRAAIDGRARQLAQR